MFLFLFPFGSNVYIHKIHSQPVSGCAEENHVRSREGYEGGNRPALVRCAGMIRPALLARASSFISCAHLWPQQALSESASHPNPPPTPQCWGLLGWRPSQKRNELIVTLRLLLLISELSTAADRRCPGSHPSITGPHRQETKQIRVSQTHSPESNGVA